MLLGIAALNRSDRPESERDPYHYGAQSERQGDAVTALAERACAEAAESRSYEPEHHEKRDLCAQFLNAVAADRTADFARLQTAIGFVGLFAVLGTLWFTASAAWSAGRQARAAVAANADARRAFEEAERPLFFVTVQSTIDKDETRRRTSTFDAAIRLENVGTRPATGSALRVVMRVIGFLDAVPRPDGPEVMAEKNTWTGGREIGVQGHELTFVGTTYNAAEVLTSEALDMLDRPYASIYVIGLLEYEDPLGVRRERGFCLQALRAGALSEGYFGKPSVFWVRANGAAYNFDRRKGEKPSGQSRNK